MRIKHVTDRKISALLDRELSPTESEAICGHIDQCQRCREKLLGWQRIEQYLRHHEREIAPPTFFEQKILAQVHREANTVAMRSNRQPWLLGLKSHFATAGLVALGIFLGTIMGAKLTAFLASERENVDLIAVLSAQDASFSSVTGVGLDFIGESP